VTPSKRQLFVLGQLAIERWCDANNVPRPRVEESGDPTMFGTCAYYRDNVIYIAVDACAAVGMAGRAWSYPGYVVDRTPFGVLAHELGHHVERAHGAAGGIFASRWRQETNEAPITSYAPNVNEWFAEIFRLFVTNPNLLEQLRPGMFVRLLARWPQRIEPRTWSHVLAGADRQIRAAENKIADARKKQSRALLAGVALR
jgi:hypothetical protein